MTTITDRLSVHLQSFAMQITWYCPADDVVEHNESGRDCRGVVADTQVDVECDGDCPEERTDT